MGNKDDRQERKEDGRQSRRRYRCHIPRVNVGAILDSLSQLSHIPVSDRLGIGQFPSKNLWGSEIDTNKLATSAESPDYPHGIQILPYHSKPTTCTAVLADIQQRASGKHVALFHTFHYDIVRV